MKADTAAAAMEAASEEAAKEVLSGVKDPVEALAAMEAASEEAAKLCLSEQWPGWPDQGRNGGRLRRGGEERLGACRYPLVGAAMEAASEEAAKACVEIFVHDCVVSRNGGRLRRGGEAATFRG